MAGDDSRPGRARSPRRAARRLAYAQQLLNVAAVARAVTEGLYAGTAELARLLGVAPQTVRGYCDFLRRDLQAPLAYSRTRRGYHLTRPWDFGKALLSWLAAGTSPP
jgi:hypothetical protein